MTGNPIPVIEKTIYSLLSGDGALAALVGARIWSTVGPEIDPATGLLPAYPQVIYQQQSPGAPTRLVGGGVLMDQPLYFIRAVGLRSAYASTRQAAARIDALFNILVPIGKTDPDGQAFVVGAVREQPMADAIFSKDGRMFDSLGALYRFYVTN